MKKCVLLGVVALATGAGSANADIINISSGGFGLEGLGAFTGSISYSSGVLTISLTNDLSTAAGGKITAVAFNINGVATTALTAGTHPFADLGTSVSAAPFGTFEGGAGLGGSWLGGGSPNSGIVRGATGVFTFAVTGAGAGSLTAADFIGDNVGFVVRFRGFDNGGSDKTVGHTVPAPASLAMVGLGALAAGRRRR